MEPHYFLGIDGDGRLHHWDRRQDTIHVISDGERVFRQPLPADMTPDDWMAHVGEWERPLYGTSRVAGVLR